MGRTTEGVSHSIVGALFLALVSTLGDWIWAKFLTHKIVNGVVHGALMCLCIGLVLGWRAGGGRAFARGALGSLGLGALISAAFYPLYSLLGMSAMFICWMLLWMAFSLIFRKLVDSVESLFEAISRGVLAAVLSAAGFYPMYILWTKPPENPSYILFFLAWTIAFLPGFLPILTVKRESSWRMPDRDYS